MKTKELRPIRPDHDSVEDIRKAILRLLIRWLYSPLLKDLSQRPEVLRNTRSELSRLIFSGQLWYHNGHFRGRFNSGASKELRALGAEWDRTHGSWKVPQSKLPQDIRDMLAASEQRFLKKMERVNRRLNDLTGEEIAGQLDITKLFDRTIYRFNESFEDSIAAVSIAPELTAANRKRLAKEYSENMQLYVQDFADHEIRSLRKEITEHTISGGRNEEMAKTIRKSYGVSEGKARFLAKQETNLLTAKLAQIRYQDAGVNKYRWRCVAGSALHPVRPMHKALDGTVHSWDNPPIVDEHGNRKHPRQDYNCRCIAIPIVTL